MTVCPRSENPEDVHELRQALSEERQRNMRMAQELERLQARVQEAERYRFLFEAMEEGFCIIQFIPGADGQWNDYLHLMANPAYCRHAGLSDVVGRTLREVIPDEAEIWLERFGEVERTGDPIYFEHDLYATDRCLGLAAIRVEPAEHHQVAVIFRDVTARKRAETALHTLNTQLERRIEQAVAERKIFADLIDASVACVQVVDRHMRWLAVNAATRVEFQRIFAFEPEIGAPLMAEFSAATSDCQRSLALWRKALSGETFIEIDAFGEGAARRHYEMRFAPLHDNDGQPVGAYLFAYDITERVQEQQRLAQAEQALRQAQKMEAVGQLTGGVAHDFNNLLGGILGALELADQRVQQQRHDALPLLLGNAKDATLRAASLVHRLLAFSRQQILQPKPTAVAALVEGMRELIARTVGPHIDLSCQNDDELWTVRIDPPQLESALLNLCINARDAISGNGAVRIACSNVELDEQDAAILDLGAGQYVRISVDDNGRGMEKPVLARAMDPFFTTKPLGQGTGLGLSMIFGFVRQSGGQLKIASIPGQGTSISMFLPRHHGAAQCLRGKTTGCVVAPQTQGSARNVAVVEDELAMRKVMGEVLEEMGHEVRMFKDGPEAVAGLQASKAPDLLVTDVGLPGGLNGRQVAGLLRQRYPGLKVLFVTGYDETAALGDGGLETGMSVLTKPFSLQQLAEQVDCLLQE
ncbi:PAS domain-containing protein [Pseudomonas soli]|uniref:hybrid sensor histidine kinase/response regulator n=2 Tax=Pseudomonas soli TaxID=1306993 RepID=UPI0039E16A48